MYKDFRISMGYGPEKGRTITIRSYTVGDRSVTFDNISHESGCEVVRFTQVHEFNASVKVDGWVGTGIYIDSADNVQKMIERIEKIESEKNQAK